MQALDHHLCPFTSWALYLIDASSISSHFYSFTVYTFLVPSNDLQLIQLKVDEALFMMVAQ